MLVVLYGRRQFSEQSKFLHSRDSLDVAVRAFQSRHDSLLRVDTVRETHIVALRQKADTLIRLVEQRTTDTVVLRLVDAASTVYRQAIDSLEHRVAFWRLSYDSAAAQRDAALRLLALMPRPTHWSVAATVDATGGVNLCGLRSMVRILGVGLNLGVCWRR